MGSLKCVWGAMGCGRWPGRGNTQTPASTEGNGASWDEQWQSQITGSFTAWSDPLTILHQIRITNLYKKTKQNENNRNSAWIPNLTGKIPRLNLGLPNPQALAVAASTSDKDSTRGLLTPRHHGQRACEEGTLHVTPSWPRFHLPFRGRGPQVKKSYRRKPHCLVVAMKTETPKLVPRQTWSNPTQMFPSLGRKIS